MTARPGPTTRPTDPLEPPALSIIDDGGRHRSALQKGLHLYQTMFEPGSLGQLIVSLPSFRIAAVISAFCTMAGFEADALLGTDVAILFPPDGRNEHGVGEHRNDRRSDPHSSERVLRRRDGTTVLIQSIVSVVRDEEGRPAQLLVLGQNVPGRVAQEEQHRRDHALIEAALAAALPVTFTTFDTNLRITAVAGGLERAGSQASDFLGRHVSEITDDAAVVRSLNSTGSLDFDPTDGPRRQKCGLRPLTMSHEPNINLGQTSSTHLARHSGGSKGSP